MNIEYECLKYVPMAYGTIKRAIYFILSNDYHYDFSIDHMSSEKYYLIVFKLEKETVCLKVR